MRVGRILALGALLSLGIWANAAQQKVAIRAYINVTSGCQAPTEAFLEGLQHKYAGKVSVEFIDFGDGGKGLARWRQSGLPRATRSSRCQIPRSRRYLRSRFSARGRSWSIYGTMIP